MPRRNPARLLLIVLFAAVSTALALWATTPQWGAALLRQQLHKQGIQLDAITLRRPHWRQLEIDRLALTLPAGAYAVQVDSRGIAIHYHLRELLTGTVERIDMAQLQLQLHPAEPVTTPAKTASALPLPSDVFTRLPVREVHIADLRVELHVDVPALQGQQFTGHLDFDTQALTLQLQGSSPVSLTPAPPTFSLRADRHNQIDLQLRNAGKDVLTLSNRLTRTATNAAHTTASTTIEGELHGDLDALQKLMLPGTLALAGAIEAHWRGQMPGTLDDQLLQQLTLDGDIRTHFSVAAATLPAVDGTFAGQFKLADNQLRATIDSGEFSTHVPAPAALANLYKFKPGQLLPVTALIDPSTRVLVDINTQRIEVDPVRIDVRMQQRRAGLDTRVRLDALSLQLDPTLQAKAHLTAITPALPVSTMRLQPAQLDATLTLADQQLNAIFRLHDVAGVYRIDGSASHQLNTRSGTLHAKLQPLLFKEKGNYLPQLFKPWRWPFDLASGELQLQGDLHWSPTAISGDGALQAINVGGFYDRTLFSGLNTNASVNYRDGKIRVAPTIIAVKNIQAGLPIRALTAKLEATPDALLLHDFSTELFGGTVSQNLIRYNWRETEHRFALQLNHLQLDQILALQEGAEGNGTLDGTIPVSLGPKGIRVDGAQLKARTPGGVLRYQSDVPISATTNAGLAIALKALKNFHYSAMSVQADYAENGDLALGVALQGRNPTALDTPPVNFNLNIHENMPDLLRTLQLGQDISDSIEQRIKKQQP